MDAPNLVGNVQPLFLVDTKPISLFVLSAGKRKGDIHLYVQN